MTNKNYINIQGWMINELELKGNELILYALIYGFTQDGRSMFRGSISYIMKALRMSNKGVINILSKLIKKGLIKKKISNSGNEYKALVNKVHRLPVNKVPKACEQSSHNNNRDNNKDNKYKERFSNENLSESPSMIVGKNNVGLKDNNKALSNKFSSTNNTPPIKGEAPPELTYDDNIEQTYKTKNKIFEQKGLQIAKYKIKTVKQRQTFDGLRLIDHFKNKGKEKGLTFMEEITLGTIDGGFETQKVKDLNTRNQKLRMILIEAVKKLGYDKCIEMVDWYFNGNGEYSGYSPEGLFNSVTIEKFNNKKGGGRVWKG